MKLLIMQSLHPPGTFFLVGPNIFQQKNLELPFVCIALLHVAMTHNPTRLSGSHCLASIYRIIIALRAERIGIFFSPSIACRRKKSTENTKTLQ
jgi:hypothetical protein